MNCTIELAHETLLFLFILIFVLILIFVSRLCMVDSFLGWVHMNLNMARVGTKFVGTLIGILLQIAVKIIEENFQIGRFSNTYYETIFFSSLK